MSKEFKQLAYSNILHHQYDELIDLCENTLTNVKGKDSIVFFWKAFAFGMLNNKRECFGCLDSSLVGRKDLQFPVSMAKLYFNRLFYSEEEERENIESLEAELLVSEDITVLHITTIHEYPTPYIIILKPVTN